MLREDKVVGYKRKSFKSEHKYFYKAEYRDFLKRYEIIINKRLDVFKMKITFFREVITINL